MVHVSGKWKRIRSLVPRKRAARIEKGDSGRRDRPHTEVENDISSLISQGGDHMNKSVNEKPMLLTDDFIAKYPDFPEHMNELGKFVYYRTYSRWLESEKRRETWKETVRRSVEYNVGLAIKHCEKEKIPYEFEAYREEAEKLFDNIFNLRQFLSGRTHWVGGADTGVADKYPLSNFNCSFISINKWDDLGDVFYLLLIGAGVGVKCTKKAAANLAPIRTNTKLIHSEYNPVAPDERLENSEFIDYGNGYAKLLVGDSKEAWCDALALYLRALTDESYEHIHTVKISYNSVRPAGERLKTFGGTASGPEPLREMFEGIDLVLKNKIDPHLDPIETDEKGYGRVRPIHILDMVNLIGNGVVAGGVRRTAEIFLFDANDYESMFAKYGINGVWDEARHKRIIEKMERLDIPVPQWMREINIGDANARPLHHRRMSNNSIAFTRKPSREFLNLVFEIMRAEGEPGFVNLEELARRRLAALGIKNPSRKVLDDMIERVGMNPCAEIILESYQVCNLTTVNVAAFVTDDGNFNYDELFEAQKLSARAALRMTLPNLELPNWNKTHHRDRLTGCSLTGWQDALDRHTGGANSIGEGGEILLGILRKRARDAADEYAKELRVPAPLLATAVKPEGTLSQVAGGVSSGLHYSHAPYYIRRVRISAHDPIAKAVRAMGWRVYPEIGTPGETEEERMKNARTLVLEFPIASGATRTKDDISVEEQFDVYFRFQREYTEHNASNTIHVRPHEWAIAEEIVWNKWDGLAAVSFLPHDGGSYQLAPYETISREQYEEMKAKMPTFDPAILRMFENGEDFDLGTDGCDSGACPIR
jgi:ribonucleoside-triphosphate reductase (thioredoxin)